MDSVGLKGIAARQLDFRGLPWETLIHTLPIGIYTCDSAGRLVRYNSQAAELWGRAPDLDRTDYRFCGRYKAYRLTGEPIDFAQGPIAQVLKTGKPMRAKEAILERPDGSRIFIQADTEPLFDEAVGKAATCEVDLALLDINLGGKKIYPVAEVLARRKVPMVFSTGYGAAGIEPHWQRYPVVQKPFMARELERALAQAREMTL